MDIHRYSKSELDTLESDPAELSRRLEELQDDVQLELHAAISQAFEDIIERLNESGHTLKMEPHSKPGELDYEDTQERFYVCCDTIISAGFRGTVAKDAQEPPG